MEFLRSYQHSDHLLGAMGLEVREYLVNGDVVKVFCSQWLTHEKVQEKSKAQVEELGRK